MPSAARLAFDQNVKDIRQLLDLQEHLNPPSKSGDSEFEVLNKSAIVLLAAFWESYCEDIAAEGLEHMVKNVTSCEDLPKSLKKQIATEIKSAPNDLEVWKIAGGNWKCYVRDRLKHFREARNRKLNTPKSVAIDELFRTTLGIERLSNGWKISKQFSPDQARKKLDELIDLRGAIAHRGTSHDTVAKTDVVDYSRFITRLASRTGGIVNVHVRRITHLPLWD